MPLTYAWMDISWWSVKKMETCTLFTSHKKEFSSPGYVCLHVCSVLELLLSLLCLLGFVIGFYSFVHTFVYILGVQALVQKPSRPDKKTYYYLITEESKYSAGKVSIE